MSLVLHAGPIEFQITWVGRTEPRGFASPNLKFYHVPSGASPILVTVEVGEEVSELPLPPDSCLHLKNNWCLWLDDRGALQLQIWCGEIERFALHAEIRSDFMAVKVKCLQSHPRRKNLAFLLMSVTKWLSAHVAVAHGGFLLHAAAIRNQTGQVFLGIGASGAGKTTLAKFFKNCSDFEVLNDETTVVIRQDKQFMAHGSPWHGMLARASNSGGECRAAFYLEKTTDHLLRDISFQDSGLLLVREIFLPPWSHDLTQKTLDSVLEFAASVSQRRLGFKKAPSICNFIRGVQL